MDQSRRFIPSYIFKISELKERILKSFFGVAERFWKEKSLSVCGPS